MSDKSNFIKETKELLEDAQKEVLKTLNSETSFLSRLFSGSAKNSLKIAQSSISKAMNQIKNLREDESSTAAKLQKRISERDEKIKSLENEVQQKNKEAGDLNDKIRQLEAKITDLEKIPEPQATTQKVVEAKNNSGLEDSLRETIAKLESKTTFLTEKLDQNKKELKDSNNLVLEFSSRIKRLKSELTTK
jgi:chromosome segregation ATPase